MRAIAHLLILLLGLLSSIAFASNVTTNDLDERWLGNLEQELAKINGRLSQAMNSGQEASLLPWLPERVRDIGDETKDCASETQERLRIIDEALKAIGEVSATDTPALWRKHQKLQRNQGEARALLASCKLISLEADRLDRRMEDFLKTRIADRLLHRGPAIWDVVMQFIANPKLLNDLSRSTWNHTPMSDGHQNHWGLVWLIAALCIGFGIGFLLRKSLLHWQRRLSSSGFRHALIANYCARMPMAIAALFVGIVGTVINSPLVLLFAYPLALYWLISPFIRAWLCRPEAKADSETESSSPAVVTEACRIAQALRPALALALLWIGGQILNVEAELSQHTILLLRQIYAVVLAILMLRIVWLLAEIPALAAWRHWKAIVSLSVFSGPLAEFLGYQQLAQFLFNGVVGSLLALALGVLLGRFVYSRLDSLNEGRTDWDQRLRSWMGFASQDQIRASFWLKLITTLCLGILSIGLILQAWGIPQTALDRLLNVFTDGFQVGEATVVPLRLLLAIIGFVLFMLLSRWLRVQISERWLAGNRVDRGAREAITNLSVYALISIAVLLALNVAGVDLSNLAIVAGALSVGIGFGLQNIVNNFVSGLILLFERPIRPGDWVVVGETEGYVKKINIRYTLLQTFDRSDVIVPNSELLSTQVTNWMLRDSFGRVIVPVGVAYGTNVEKVREILLKIGKEHPLVLSNDPRVASPKVYLLGFGASSLDFDLRVFIRDVDYRLSVRSDLLFSINKAFQEAGIEIPFPQQDVHIRSGLDIKPDTPTSTQTEEQPGK